MDLTHMMKTNENIVSLLLQRVDAVLGIQSRILETTLII